jgi:hypothetical protein
MGSHTDSPSNKNTYAARTAMHGSRNLSDTKTTDHNTLRQNRRLLRGSGSLLQPTTSRMNLPQTAYHNNTNKQTSKQSTKAQQCTSCVWLSGVETWQKHRYMCAHSYHAQHSTAYDTTARHGAQRGAAQGWPWQQSTQGISTSWPPQQALQHADTSQHAAAAFRVQRVALSPPNPEP